jgi:hypothetical protein
MRSHLQPGKYPERVGCASGQNPGWFPGAFCPSGSPVGRALRARPAGAKRAKFDSCGNVGWRAEDCGALPSHPRTIWATGPPGCSPTDAKENSFLANVPSNHYYRPRIRRVCEGVPCSSRFCEWIGQINQRRRGKSVTLVGLASVLTIHRRRQFRPRFHL